MRKEKAMKRRKLKKFVLPSIYVLSVMCIFLTVYFLNSSLNFTNQPKKEDKDVLVQKENPENQDVSVVSPVALKPIVPFINDKVTISKSFYRSEDDETVQQQSLIYYQNTYMQNTGILYSSDEQFEILASVDGTVKEIKEDEILGQTVVIEYNTNVITMYYSLNEVFVTAGSKVKSGDVIGTSGKNKLENEKENCLLFEVYQKGILMNPTDFFNMNLEDLN